MRLRRAVRAILVLQPTCLGLALLGSCGERGGDPIVALPSVQTTAGRNGTAGAGATTGGISVLAAGGFGGDDGSGVGGAAGDAPVAGQGGSPPASLGFVGLCGHCHGPVDCGDGNDLCLVNTGPTFCGRDCDESGGCPEGYFCSEILDSNLLQCVPAGDACPVSRLATPSLSVVRDSLLARINEEREARGLAALSLSSCLNSLAQDSALEFARGAQPAAKFERECAPIWPACDCDWSAQAELGVARWGLDWRSAVDAAMGIDADQADPRFVDAFLSLGIVQVGIGFWMSGDEAWWGLSFS